MQRGHLVAAVFAGQSALVTGGGSGIGLESARHLAADGAAVLLAGRTEAKLTAAVDALRAEGFTADYAVCDVANEDHVRAAVDKANGLGRLSVAVASAGVGHGGPFHHTTLEQWNDVMNTNLTGAFLTFKHAAVAIGRAGGSLVAISSIAGPLTHRHMTPYCVSKAGLEMLVKNVADELGEIGLRANAVRPSLVPTDITSGLMAMPELVNDYLEQIPVGRLGTEGDVAQLVRFLAGPESSWITGQCIAVDGGHTLRRGPNLHPLMSTLFGDDVAPR